MMKKQPTFFLQLRAVLLKNLSLQFRQRVMLIAQFTPLLVLFIVCVVLSLSNGNPASPIIVGIANMTQFNYINTSISQSGCWLGYRFMPSQTATWVPFWVSTADEQLAKLVGTLDPKGTNYSTAGFLSTIQQSLFYDTQHAPPWNITSYQPYVQHKNFSSFADMNAGWGNFLSRFKAWNVPNITSYYYTTPYDQCRGNGFSNNPLYDYNACKILFEAPALGTVYREGSFDEKQFRIKYDSLIVNYGFPYPGGTYYPYATNFWFWGSSGYSNAIYNSPTQIMQLIHSAIYRYLTNYTPSFGANANSYGIARMVDTCYTSTCQQYYCTSSGPILTLSNTWTVTSAILQHCTWVIGLFLLFPLFMQKIVVERSSGLSEMSKLAGLSSSSYWTSMFIQDMGTYIILTLGLVIIGLASQFYTLLYVSPLWYLSLLCYGYSIVSISYFFALFFASPTNAQLFGYISALLLAGLGIVLNMVVFATGVPFPVYVHLIPPFAAMRAMFVLIHTCVAPTLCPHSMAVTTALWSLLYCVVFSSVYVILALYLDQVLPKSEGYRKSIFYPITALYEYIVGCAKSRNDYAYKRIPDNVEPIQEEDKLNSDLRLEIDEIWNTANASPLVVKGVCKQFTMENQKINDAVRNIWLHVDMGDCFGLLGPNGAGKTTLVNMIVGLTNPSRGSIAIGGLDISKEKNEAVKTLGLCPQFDVLYEDLTVEEHLLFYARLWGYGKGEDIEQVNRILNEIGLYADKDNMGTSLSGGQKRRLSIGIALCGDPALVVLDEPTSGLDIGSKRGVWEIISNARNKRAFLLTTHSMEEAEVLCTKIGIMSKGEMKCLGSKNHLKKKYGHGLKLELMIENFGIGDIESHPSHRFVRSLIPEATILEKGNGIVVYNLPATTLLSKVFIPLQLGHRAHGIINCALTQSNLQEVFLSITRKDEPEYAEGQDAGTQSEALSVNVI